MLLCCCDVLWTPSRLLRLFSIRPRDVSVAACDCSTCGKTAVKWCHILYSWCLVKTARGVQRVADGLLHLGVINRYHTRRGALGWNVQSSKPEFTLEALKLFEEGQNKEMTSISFYYTKRLFSLGLTHFVLYDNNNNNKKPKSNAHLILKNTYFIYIYIFIYFGEPHIWWSTNWTHQTASSNRTPMGQQLPLNYIWHQFYQQATLSHPRRTGGAIISQFSNITTQCHLVVEGGYMHQPYGLLVD